MNRITYTMESPTPTQPTLLFDEIAHLLSNGCIKQYRSYLAKLPNHDLLPYIQNPTLAVQHVKQVG